MLELQTVLILCGIGVAGVAVLLLMGLFSTSGTSYEEAIAQQRRAANELLALADNKKPKKANKKANKKLAKKEKRESATAVKGSDLESDVPAESGVEEDSAPPQKPHVEFSPPVVVDVQRDTPPNVKIRKRGKDPKVKPILLNKDDPSCVSDPSTPPSPTSSVSNHFEEIHPKDDFELLHSTISAEKASEKLQKEEKESVDKKDVKGKSKGTKTIVKPAPPPEPVKEEIQKEKQNNAEAPKDQRKAKKTEKRSVSESKEEIQEAPKEEVVVPLNPPQPSELTTEKLLKNTLPAVQTAPAPKNKKKKQEPNVLQLMAAGDGGGVNVNELVAVLREAALSRTELQLLTDALLDKHHDPLPQHSEWSEGPNDPVQKLKKQLADKEKALADEVEASQALHAKLKELRTTLNTERSRATNATRAAEQAAATNRAELHTLQTRIQRLQEENRSLAQDKLVLQSQLAADGEAQAQRVQMEIHIQRLSEQEAALMTQLAALQAEANARALEAGGARCEADAARDAALRAQQHVLELQHQAQEAQRRLAESEQRAQHELRRRAQHETELQTQVQQLTERSQNAESSSVKLKEELEALKKELEKATDDSEKVNELEKQKQQVVSEVTSLRTQLAAVESELAEARQLRPSQNGLPQQNEADSHKAAELSKIEGVVERLHAELGAARDRLAEQGADVTRLQDQLQRYQHKNDEALAKAEESQYKEVASILRAACPNLAPASASGRQWLQDFAQALKQQLEAKAAAPPAPVAPSDDRLNDLVTQNKNMQGLVDKYKQIIDDTEGVLSGLQQRVTREEQQWAQQLAEKQQQLDDMRQRTITQMQNKIDSLQLELQQAKAANHNQSFADSERSTEERLMAGLSEKHRDVSNGPLQMSLEDM